MSLGTAGKLILAFVTLLLGAVLITSLATNATNVTEKTEITDESIDISSLRMPGGGEGGPINESLTVTVTNNPTSWKIDDCPLTSVTVSNSTTDFTLNTDYNITLSSGVITFSNTTTTVQNPENTTLVDYTYCPDDYMNISWGRSVTNLIAGFFAIALLLTAVGLFFSVAKDTGIV